MGLLSGITGGAQTRALRSQAEQLRAQQYREQEMFRLQQEAVNAGRLDLFEKDRLSQEAGRLAEEQLRTPGAEILLDDSEGGDPVLARQRRAGFFVANTEATL